MLQNGMWKSSFCGRTFFSLSWRKCRTSFSNADFRDLLELVVICGCNVVVSKSLQCRSSDKICLLQAKHEAHAHPEIRCISCRGLSLGNFGNVEGIRQITWHSYNLLVKSSTEFQQVSFYDQEFLFPWISRTEKWNSTKHQRGQSSTLTRCKGLNKPCAPRNTMIFHLFKVLFGTVDKPVSSQLLTSAGKVS